MEALQKILDDKLHDMLAGKRMPAWAPINPPQVNDGPVSYIVNGIEVRPGEAFPPTDDAVFIPVKTEQFADDVSHATFDPATGKWRRPPMTFAPDPVRAELLAALKGITALFISDTDQPDVVRAQAAIARAEATS